MDSTGANHYARRFGATRSGFLREVCRPVTRRQYRCPSNLIDSFLCCKRGKIVVAVGDKMKPDIGLVMKLLAARPKMMGQLDQARIVLAVDEIDGGLAIGQRPHQGH